MSAITRVVAITSINSVVLYFASLLAAGGDGNPSGVNTVQLVGYTWIAFVLCAKNRGRWERFSL